ncbi:hypothetical protein BDV96DRAFT_559913 [Lophiotrema nucula]|uniref:3beta-hydroxysteroid 3-dehydrogenase n=1 Tax=Lophiotrema nucula TaxID=690887 RepID=A0A6A5YHQ7_9PLEO|nr:hypothetical protein BDV96DRAFT_559913 [Lophiotrema nucula]
MGTILLTGANGSLAIPAVQYLLSKHADYTLVLAVRNTTENDPNTSRLRTTIAHFPNAITSIRKLDLGTLSAVQAFANEVQEDVKQGRLPPIAAIICNAFTWTLNSAIQYSSDGYESSMAVNHIGHLSLVLRLLGSMDEEKGRIVFLSSESHEPGKAGFEVYPPTLPADLELLVHPGADKKGEEIGRGFMRYGLSKLLVVMCMYVLMRRLENSEELKGISVIALDPGGLLDSRAFSPAHVPGFWKILLSIMNFLQPVLKLLKPTMRRTGDAARDLVDLTLDPRYADQEGHFVMAQKTDSSLASRDEGMQEAVWSKTLEWCHITQKDTVLPL